jgi:DNA-binding winged helix-turn-helix (wHTH) protein/TolB-like protein/tetratricopeptide (TPR) repeat protein
MTQAQHVYEFGPFRLDTAERLLLRAGDPVPVTAKAFDTLLVLVQKNGHLVEKSELIHAVWSDSSFVEEGNLTVVICALRKALGDDNGERKYIQTVAKRGYRFVGQVREVAEPDSEPARQQPAAVVESSTPPPEALRGGQALSPARKTGVLVVATLGIVLSVMLFWKASGAGNDPAEIHSLAVLPFRPLNPDTQDNLTVGMADAIITRLGSTGHIIVRPTSAVLKYARSSADPLAVGREQKVDAILEGSIELLADGVQVGVQLVRVRDGVLLWAATFKEGPGRLFALGQEVAEGVVQSLPFHLSAEAKMPVARADAKDSKDSKAYQPYLEGRYFLNKRTEQAVHRSIESFKQAIAADQEYALAYSGLADAYVLLGTYGEPPWELYPNAKATALKAVELDSTLAEAHASLAMISFHYEWNWVEAEKEFQRAIALNPNDPMAHAWYGMYLGAMARHDQALAEATRARELDPLSPVVNLVISRVFYWKHEYDRAIQVYSKVIDLDPQFASAHTRLGMAYLAKHAFWDAVREFETAQGLSVHDPYLNGLLGYAQALSGNTATALKLVSELNQLSRRQYVPAFSVALVYVGLGDRDRALEWLARSYQDRSTHMVYAKVDPLLDPLRADPRFTELLRKMGLL